MQSILSERSQWLHAQLKKIPSGEKPIYYPDELKRYRSTLRGKISGWVVDNPIILIFPMTVGVITGAGEGMYSSLSYSIAEGAAFISMEHLIAVTPGLAIMLGSAASTVAGVLFFGKAAGGIDLPRELFNSVTKDLRLRGYQIIDSSQEKFSFTTPQGVFMLTADADDQPVITLNGARVQRSYEAASARQPESLTAMDGSSVAVSGAVITS